MPLSNIELLGVALFTAVLLQAPVQADAQTPADQVMQSALPPELTAMFPIGREFIGVAIPSYTGEALKSVMRAESVIRVDDRYLDLVDLIITIYNGKEEAETTITMDEAAYDLTLSELRSKTPSTIEQPRFVMTGDTMIFESNSQVSRLEGNVRVVVPDARKLSPEFGLPSSKDSK
tara:strand:+ start:211 stop:738 length:528 start_codon:yes stop_codon:yes gene_type:complete